MRISYKSFGSILLVGCFGVAAGQSVVHTTGLTVKAGGIAYYLPAKPVGKIEDDPNSLNEAQFRAITVINTNATSMDCAAIQETTETFLRIDDVIQDLFLKDVYIFHDSLPSNGNPIVNLGGCGRWVSRGEAVGYVPDGPYFLSREGSLYEAHRLYSDTQGAFTETVTTAPEDGFSVLPANSEGQALSVAVPSRLYFTRTSKKPLAGMRLGVKDIFDVQGVRTSNGNRAWYQLYPPANKSAVAVQRLLGAGAVLVGKMKTSQFANGETATADWIDYLAPFNPRGDGYEDPSSSSAGPAVGIAAYDWLDIALGSDTGGSIRSPSQMQGIFGNRPTHGIVPLDGVMPLSPSFDTAGIMTREPQLWRQALGVLYDSPMEWSSSFPSKILTIVFPDKQDTLFEKCVSGFLSNVAKFLNATVAPIDISAEWERSGPIGERLQKVVNNTYEIISAREQATLLREPFYQDYKAAHNGRLPHVNPAPLQRWNLSDTSSAQTVEAAYKNQTMFSKWIQDTVLPSSKTTCSKSILIYVPRVPSPKYRDNYLSGPALPSAFSTSRISVLAGIPDIVVPIGETPYQSRITGETEFLPIAVDIVAGKGCDSMLAALVEALYEANIVSKSASGKSNVSGGMPL